MAQLEALRHPREAHEVLDDEIAAARARAGWRRQARKARRRPRARCAATPRWSPNGHGWGPLRDPPRGDRRGRAGRQVPSGPSSCSANAGQPPRRCEGGVRRRAIAISFAIEVAALGRTRSRRWYSTSRFRIGARLPRGGEKLRAARRQTPGLCFTHLPQWRGRATHTTGEQAGGGDTRARCSVLTPAERQENGTNVGGVEVSREARAAAKRLLADAVWGFRRRGSQDALLAHVEHREWSSRSSVALAISRCALRSPHSRTR